LQVFHIYSPGGSKIFVCTLLVSWVCTLFQPENAMKYSSHQSIETIP